MRPNPADQPHDELMVRTVNVPGCTITIAAGTVIAVTDGYVNEPARVLGVLYDRADGDGVVATTAITGETRDLTSARHAVLWLLGEEAALA